MDVTAKARIFPEANSEAAEEMEDIDDAEDMDGEEEAPLQSTEVSAEDLPVSVVSVIHGLQSASSIRAIAGGLTAVCKQLQILVANVNANSANNFFILFSLCF